MISDMVLKRELPAVVLDSIDVCIGCVGGVSRRARYLETISRAGFREVRVRREAGIRSWISLDDSRVRESIDKMGIGDDEVKSYVDAVTSLDILAVK